MQEVCLAKFLLPRWFCQTECWGSAGGNRSSLPPFCPACCRLGFWVPHLVLLGTRCTCTPSVRQACSTLKMLVNCHVKAPAGGLPEGAVLYLVRPFSKYLMQLYGEWFALQSCPKTGFLPPFFMLTRSLEKVALPAVKSCKLINCGILNRDLH